MFVFIRVISQLPRGLGPSRWFVPRVIAVNDMRFLEGISHDNGPIKFRNSSLWNNLRLVSRPIVIPVHGSARRYREATARILDDEEEEEEEEKEGNGESLAFSISAYRHRSTSFASRDPPVFIYPSDLGDSCVFVKISGAFPSIFVGTPELPGRGGNWRAASDELKRRSNEPNEPEPDPCDP